ncbi:taste receptor type 2 member 41-like [Pseudophryne corroboree]|uniref:taste receptor type 2 member 41-like n=1 Tax=Pseudophryne corroboree TaxID=495146 RepID=UPI003081344A
MSSTLFLITGSMDVAIFLLSAPGNTFILFVNILDVVNSKALNLSDQLICSISVVTICHQFLYVLEFITFSLTKEMFSEEAAVICFIFMLQTITSCNLWLSTWLCVHFCIKIVNIKQRCYIYLQKMFPKTFKWILMSTILGSSLISFSSVLGSLMLTQSDMTYNDYGLPAYEKQLSSTVLYSLTFSVSIVVLCTSALTIIISLSRHMKRIQDNSEGSITPSVEAHVQATRTILSLLVINILYSIDGLRWFIVKPFLIYHYVSLICSSVSQILKPWILIKGNSKLDGALQQVLHSCTSPRISNDT